MSILLGSTLLLQFNAQYTQLREENGICITFLIFPDYAEKATALDPLKETLAWLSGSYEYHTKVVVSNESYAFYRFKAFLRIGSILNDPDGGSNEYIIPVARLGADKTGNLWPRIEADLPRSVYNALSRAPFIWVIYDVSEAIGFVSG